MKSRRAVDDPSYVVIMARVWCCGTRPGRRWTGRLGRRHDGPVPGINRAVVTGVLVAGFAGLVRPIADRVPERIKEAHGLGATGPLVTVVVALAVAWRSSIESSRLWYWAYCCCLRLCFINGSRHA